ncbi:uncharacterized protein LOC114519189 [Dendronephthya gigantea]|uniref:uncharacterized protein LOC114519189 n=1 Tax=Dendronephthya gigantea TaxID=151771 RepID=UPI00106A947F|nr:uncharacterized protein LOC114519189 [Dendronephthya gigantea]
MKLNRIYLLLNVVLIVFHYVCATNGEKMLDDAVRQSLTRENEQNTLVTSKQNLDHFEKRPVRKLVRRSLRNETSETNKGLQEDVGNSTGTKLQGDELPPGSSFPSPDGSGFKHDPLPGKFDCPRLEESCQNKCSNRTRFVETHRMFVPMCGCDTSCNDIFTDCCSDYTKHCGSNTVVRGDHVYEASSYLQCESEINLFLRPCEPPSGVWMIKKCPLHWTDDVIRHKCDSPSKFLDNRTYDTLVPVYSGVNNMTYRNQYCAICHNVTSYEFWELSFSELAIPPSHFNKEQFINFLNSNIKHFRGIQPKDSFFVRYCYFPDVVKSCSKTSKFENARACINGTVEIVRSENRVFYKNRACSSCHDVKSPCPVKLISPTNCFVLPADISRSMNLQDYDVVKVTRTCPQGEVYDPYISKCRPSYQPLVLNSSGDSYRITMSLLRYTLSPMLMESNLPEDISENFNLSRRQILDVKVASSGDKYIISFTLHLTPEQSLIISANNYGNPSNLDLWKLLKFQNAFPLLLGNRRNLTVFRVRVRRLACIHWGTYQVYSKLPDNRLYVNQTMLTYEPYEYEINGPAPKPTARVCSKLAPFRINGSYIGLKPSEYSLLPNLTVVYKNLRYDFGEYSFVNGTVYIFVGFKRKHEISHMDPPLVLTIMNFVCYVLSEVFLVVLIVTYLLFKELRTVPGKNLLSLAISLAIADLFWLLGHEFTARGVLCTVLAIGIHYFYMVYFTACSVIAYHSCYVFGRGISALPDLDEEKRRFIIYFLVIWFAPAAFVGLLVILDQTDTLAVKYGLVNQTVCFLGTQQASMYLFALPVALSLVFNTATFIRVAKHFFKNQRTNSQFLSSELQKKRERQNVIICFRLSTLMGFSWLFIFLHFLFESVTRVFLYLFVLFVGLQGVFVCVAFVFNRKCLTLYRGLIHSKLNHVKSNNREMPNTTRTMNSIYKDTKL